MQAFATVGDELLRRYRAAEFDESLFPDIAASVLEEARLHDAVSLDTLARDVLAAEKLPPDMVAPQFSDAGVCVYHDARFTIEVLTWLDASTQIHEHKFCGAFQVLEGGSLHTEYTFRTERRVSEQLAFGALERTGIELFGAGAVQRILPGDRYIHRLYHLERPSLTLVARTHVQGAQPQYAFVEPGIRYDPFRKPAELGTRMKVLRVLQRLDHPDFVEELKARIAGSDLYCAFFYAFEYISALQARNRLDEILPVVRERFRDVAPLVERAIDERLRYERLYRLRSSVTRAEHRFFFALLLNAVDRAEVLALIATRHPDEDPSELAVRWIEELSGDDGTFTFEDGELERLAGWLRGAADDGGSDAAALQADLRRTILRPLVS